jgi:2-polyprenyl-3-methyl-5-hydroxy-6-metoxy-1,4-benzoquinol methylase
MRDGWDAEAHKWVAFARTPGHDSSHDDINLPALRGLLPEPGKRTLDLGCGEGRVSRFLRSLGHQVAGADASSAMVRLAAGHRTPSRPSSPTRPRCPLVMARSTWSWPICACTTWT